MKIKVDFDLCESNALCEALAPANFEIDDDDFLQITDENVTDENQKVGLRFTDIMTTFGRRASAAPITFTEVPRMLQAAFSQQKTPKQALDDIAGAWLEDAPAGAARDGVEDARQSRAWNRSHSALTTSRGSLTAATLRAL